MKHLIRMASVLLIMTVAACNKEPVTPEPTPDPNPLPLTKLSKLEYDDYAVTLTYNTDGNIANVINTDNDDPLQSRTYFFQYQGGKLNEITDGGKWKYHYAGNQLTKVESYNENNVMKYQSEFVYTNNRVTERIESLVSANGPRPTLKTIFQYNAQGNVSKKEMWQYTNNVWHKNEDILYPEYDTHEDQTSSFENFPYLPKGLFSANNPKKEIFVDVDGTITGTVTYTYVYDNKGRVSSIKSHHVFPGFPEYDENTKLSY
jgi:hypothetical protein